MEQALRFGGAGTAVVLLALLTAAGVGQYLKSREDGHASVGERAMYVRLPLLIPFMLASVAVLMFAPIEFYPVIGAAWGLSLPIRMVVRRKLNHKLNRFPLKLLVEWPSWLFAAGMAVVHGLFWPLSVPACYFMGNQVNMD